MKAAGRCESAGGLLFLCQPNKYSVQSIAYGEAQYCVRLFAMPCMELQGIMYGTLKREGYQLNCQNV